MRGCAYPHRGVQPRDRGCPAGDRVLPIVRSTRTKRWPAAAACCCGGRARQQEAWAREFTGLPCQWPRLTSKAYTEEAVLTYGSLTPEVPLGPFEASPIRVWSAPGKASKLHATEHRSRIRAGHVTSSELPLRAVVERMCPQCARYGPWGRPGTGAGLFLGALTGLGLLHELGSYGEADEDTFTDDEVKQAAALLQQAPQDDREGPDAKEGRGGRLACTARGPAGTRLGRGPVAQRGGRSAPCPPPPCSVSLAEAVGRCRDAAQGRSCCSAPAAGRATALLGGAHRGGRGGCHGPLDLPAEDPAFALLRAVP